MAEDSGTYAKERLITVGWRLYRDAVIRHFETTAKGAADVACLGSEFDPPWFTAEEMELWLVARICKPTPQSESSHQAVAHAYAQTPHKTREAVRDFLRDQFNSRYIAIVRGASEKLIEEIDS